MKKFILLLMLLTIPFGALSETAMVQSSYLYDYNQPPEFQPSLNSQFTSLSSSVVDVSANPAGLMHVTTLEIAVGGSAYVSNPIKSDKNTFSVDDIDLGGIQNSPNSRAYARLTDDRSAVTPESRPVNIDEDYSKGGGITFLGMTYRVADWLAFSVTRKRPTSISFNYQATAPVMVDARADFTGTSIEAGGAGNFISVRNDGTIEVLANGVVYTSEVSAWNGFLHQGTSEVNWVNGTFDDSLFNNNSVVLSAAAKTGQFSWGLNVMPETVEMDLNNAVSVVSDSGNTNPKVYLPNIDFASTGDAIAWVTMEAGLPSGYRSIEVETLAGQQIGAAQVAGKYSGSLTRMDFGMQWEPTDFLSFGAVYENFNRATLKLEGVDIIQYVEHRIDTSSQFPTQEGSTYWDPYLPAPTHEVDTENVIRNTLTMQPIELPVKVKFGMALKKPFLIAADWEQWQNEYEFSSDPGHPDTAHLISLSNISFIKLGIESQLWALPVIIRGSVTGLLKPSTNDPTTQKSLDDLFSQSTVVPVDGNIYLGFGVFDGEFGLGVGGGGLPLIQAMTFDVSELAKVFYSNVYYKRGNWQVSLLSTVDPVLTGFSSDLSNTPGTSSDLKLMQTTTLSLGVKF